MPNLCFQQATICEPFLQRWTSSTQFKLCLKKLGAVACPYKGQVSQISKPQEVVKQTTVGIVVNNGDESFVHKPSFKCNCNACADFFWDLQKEIDDLNIDLDVNSEWSDLHFSKYYSRNSEDEDEELCTECYMEPSLGWTSLCFDCDCNEFERAYDEQERQNDRKDWC